MRQYLLWHIVIGKLILVRYLSN